MEFCWVCTVMLIILILNFQAAAFAVPTVAGCAPEFEQVNGGALLEGDVFYAINGSRVYLPSDIDLLLMVANRGPIDLVVLRDGVIVGSPEKNVYF